MAVVNFTPTLLLSVLLLLSRTLAIPHSLFSRSQFCENVPTHKAGTRLNRRSFLRSNLDLVNSFPLSDLLPLTHLLPRLPARPDRPPIPTPDPPVCAVTASQDCPASHLWCAYDSSTWILTTFTLTLPASPPAVQNILSRALNQILLHIQQTTDGQVLGGLYGYVQMPTGGGQDYSTLELPAPLVASSRSPPQPSIPQGLTLTTANANNHQLTWGVLGAAIQALLNLMGNQQWWGGARATVYDGENEVGTLVLNVGVPDFHASGSGPSSSSADGNAPGGSGSNRGN